MRGGPGEGPAARVFDTKCAFFAVFCKFHLEPRAQM